MLAHQINSEDRKKIRQLLLMKHGSITKLAGELKVKQSSISGWLAYGRGLSPAKQAVIRERALELALELGIVIDSMSDPGRLSSTNTPGDLP